MKLQKSNQVATLTMPQFDLLILLIIPEFRLLLGRFPKLIKAQLLADPCQLYLHRRVIPFVLDIRCNAAIMHRVRESLQSLPPTGVKMKQI